MQDPSLSNFEQLPDNFSELIEAVYQAVIRVGSTQNLQDAIVIRNEIRRLPNSLVTEVLNQIILRLVLVNPEICRWFVLDVFLRDVDLEAKADVAERINILLADLQSQQDQR